MRSEASFRDFYHAHVGFASNRARVLGVEDAGVDDVVQHVFWVASRRFHEFRPDHARASSKAWVMAILRRAVCEHRRSARRKSPHLTLPRADPETIADAGHRGPHETLVHIEGVRQVRRLIDELDPDKREVFVLAEIEHLPVSEIAVALGVNANTAASRLKAARRDFERAAARLRLHELRGSG
jgi:RNA polymerase sigma-70 factor (ECF subfamily)